MTTFKDKKSVAIVVCAWPPNGGGIGNNAYYHLNKLLELNYSATALTPKYKDSEIDNNKNVEYLKTFLQIGKAGFLLSLFSRLKKYDIIHLYYPFFGTDILIILFKLLNRKKKLIIHYQMDPVGSGFYKLAFKLHMIMFFPILMRLTDRVVALSWDNASFGYLKKYLIKYKNKFVEIPNAIDDDIFKPQEIGDDVYRKYNLQKDDQIILFVGGLDDQHFFKGVDVLIKAFVGIHKTIDLAKLMIIGDGNKRMDYEKLTKELGISEHVIFTGWIKNEDLPEYYNMSRVFVLPSTEATESFGIVTAEAQACGVPAVVSNWPGSRQTIEDGETGLIVEPKSSKDLTDKILTILSDENKYQIMSEKAISRSKNKYSWKNVIKKIDNMYNELYEK